MVIILVNSGEVSQSDLNEGWICSGERHLWHVNDSLPRVEDGTAGTGLSVVTGVATAAAALVGEGDFSAVLIFDIYAFCFSSVIPLLILD